MITKQSSSDILLISMPFASIYQPSIGLSLLRSAALEKNLSCEIKYFSLEFARIVGRTWYDFILDTPTQDLLGEWLFSGAVFQQTEEEVNKYVFDVLKKQHPHHVVEHGDNSGLSDAVILRILEVRERIHFFLDRCTQIVVEKSPRIVGFTSIFQQQLASLALAKKIKEIRPDIHIVFGGANCEGPMGEEVVRQFSFVDAVVSGEGEETFPALASALLHGQSYGHLTGVYSKHNIAQSTSAPPRGLLVMDDLPIVDYDDFFKQAFEIFVEDQNKPEKYRVPFETSRGCWWGQKQHCTFCGLNGSTMTFRSKSQPRALKELTQLADRYPLHSVAVVDNILDMGYFKSFIPELAARERKMELFYEVKANLRKEQIDLMSQAGIVKIQPGIESLNDRVLSLMRKGVSALQNIQLLKWCKQYGVTPYWNILWGFPGESPDDYKEMASLIPLLTHLPPPSGVSSIRIDRFSPNFEQGALLGFANVEPYQSYSHIYTDIPSSARRNLAYYFVRSGGETEDLASYTKETYQEINKWKTSHKEDDLFFIDKLEYLIVYDSRIVRQRNMSILRDWHRDVYLFCDKVQPLNALHREFAEHEGCKATLAELDCLLEELVAIGIMVRIKNAYLSLAVPLGNYQPSQTTLSALRTTNIDHNA